ncbi:MAG: AEC family transporter [Litorilinea sp.]
MFVFETLLPIFGSTVLPVFLVAAAGFLLARKVDVEGRSLGRVMFYLATPALVFRSLYQTEIDPSALQLFALVAAAVTILAGIIGWLASFDQSRRKRAAIVLTSAVSNNGNMGIPICFFAFGAPGLALGTIYYVVSSFLSNTVGVIVASAGRTPIRSALGKSLSVPMLYAASGGLGLNLGNVELPLALFRAVDLLANAAIPGMLILLGIQLYAAPVLRGQGVILRSAVVRLALAPLMAWGLTYLLHMQGVERDVLILQAAMPTAVMAAVLTTEFDTEPEMVATVIFLTTVVSMGTLSVVLWFLL